MEQTNHNFLNGGGQAGISDRMRELLSRAAQEHLSEQKSQGAITEEMRQRLEGLASAVEIGRASCRARV